MDDLYDIFNDSLLGCEEDSEFIKRYSIEFPTQINKLSRHLRSILNYKNAVIQFRFSESSEVNKTGKNPFLKWESQVSSNFHRYANLLNIIEAKEGKIANKIQILLEKAKYLPNHFEINLLKELKLIGSEIWKGLHILSEFEIHCNPHLLNKLTKIAGIICSADSAFSSLLSDFFKELRLSYLQLQRELSGLLLLNKEFQIKEKNKIREVRIV